MGVISLANYELLPEPSRLGNLRGLVKDWWQATLDLVDEAKGAGSQGGDAGVLPKRSVFRFGNY